MYTSLVNGHKKQRCCFCVPLLVSLFILCLPADSHSQECPPNIDFESGSFDGWTCYTGSVAAGAGGQNIMSLTNSSGPVYTRHTMYSSTSRGELDPYGDFPVNCPNGSGYSIRLGNNTGGGEAEGISYEFTIPAGRDVYNLIYHYAVVFQDPNHLENEQPRMQIEIMNVTDNVIIDCSSFAFHPFGTLLPGFQLSSNPGTETPVWFKDWSAVSINLNGHAGKTIRLYFKTADCTFRRHFGYPYIDVNSECSGEFVGATYCPDDTAVNVVAPYGYQTYTWYDNTFTNILGSTQTLSLIPPPVAGTTIAVIVVPYNGYGCLDTLYAHLIDTLTVTANAGHDAVSCNMQPVQVGAIPKPGIVYHWDPPDGLSNASVSNPVVTPAVTTTYVLTANSSGGGCVDTDTVVVTASIIDNAIDLMGRDMFCVTSNDSAVLRVHPAQSIQWYRDGRVIPGARQPEYKVKQTGVYHALLINNDGCSVSTDPQQITIDEPKPGISYPVEYAVINLPLTLQAREFGHTVLWKPGTSLDNASQYKPVFKGTEEQLYLIEIKTASGCLTVDTQVVKVIEKIDMFVPTGFTPNNDGRNDYMRPILRGVKDLRYFRVFNRWGQLMFDMRGTGKPGWDGKYRGVEQPTQVLVWMAEGLGVDGAVHRAKGTCTLIR